MGVLFDAILYSLKHHLVPEFILYSTKIINVDYYNLINREQKYSLHHENIKT